VLEVLEGGVRLLAVVDADDPLAPSVELTLSVSGLPPRTGQARSSAGSPAY
jgi:hypothetical protein